MFRNTKLSIFPYLLLFMFVSKSFAQEQTQQSSQTAETGLSVKASEDKGSQDVASSGTKKSNIPPLQHSHIDDSLCIPNVLSMKIIGKHQYHDWKDRSTLDKDISSPKSVSFHPNGKKYYVNSLEGFTTVVYDAKTHEKLNVIHYNIGKQHDHLWAKPSNLFTFSKYTKNTNRFNGKPVESTFSHSGRYLWIPFYKRSFDLNAQDPSALAVIDTQADSIILLMETGPLPKMIATSNKGNIIAVTHWGNNTVGLIDASSTNPKDWHYTSCVAIDKKLELNFSTTEKVSRDTYSGLKLRGTAFLPDDRYLLVAPMSGDGYIGVVDVREGKFLGKIRGMMCNTRHIVIKNNYLYASVNVNGYVQKMPLDSIKDAISRLKGNSVTIKGSVNCKVFEGTRTIELSPSGRFLFATCSYASKLAVVDTKDMTLIGSIPIDSYPVGLDISPDGECLIVTSQGHKRIGGNAVNIIKVRYDIPEIAEKKTDSNIVPNKNSSNVRPDNNTAEEYQQQDFFEWLISDSVALTWAIIDLFALIGIIIVCIHRYMSLRKKRSNQSH